MDFLTTAYVSGLIAASTIIAQLIVPNVLALILVGFLDHERSAVT